MDGIVGSKCVLSTKGMEHVPARAECSPKTPCSAEKNASGVLRKKPDARERQKKMRVRWKQFIWQAIEEEDDVDGATRATTEDAKTELTAT
jgi:hypothetical protein